MGSEIVELQVPHLPRPAVESIQRHLWSNQGFEKPDVRRHVLPLVCKQWKSCLELAPDAWNEVTITDEDLWPRSKPVANFQAMTAWFKKHGKSIRKLRIDLNEWRNELCSLANLEILIIDVLRAVHGTLTHLVLRIRSAPLATAHSWRQLTNQVNSSSNSTNNQAQVWPHLAVLELEIDGKEAASQAQTSYAAKQVLSTLPCLKSLKKVVMSLNCAKLCVLPLILGTCHQIEDFSLNFSASEEPLGLILPAKRPSSLPLPPNIKILCLINSPFATEDVIDAIQIGSYRNLEEFTLINVC